MGKINPNIYLFSTGHLAVDWCQGAIPALLPFFIKELGISYQAAASVVFANLLISSLLQPFLGYYSDKVSKPWFVPIGPLFCGIGMMGLAFATSYWQIILLAMLSGAGSAVFHPEAALLVNHISTAAQRGRALGDFSVGGNAGFAIGPLVAGLCAYQLGIHYFAVFGLLNAIIAFVMYTRMGAVLALKKDNEKTGNGDVFQTDHRNHWGAFNKLTVVIFARSIGFTLCNTFIPIYFINILHSTASMGSLALTILFGVGVFMTYIGGVLSDKIGHIKVTCISFICMIPAMLFFTNSSNLLVCIALLIPMSFSLFLQYSPIVVLGQTYLAKNIGFASGITLGLGTTVGGLVAPVVGWGADNWGVGAALQILWIVAVIGAAFSFLLPDPNRLIQHNKIADSKA